LAAVFADPATAEWQAKRRPASRIGFAPIPFPFSKKAAPKDGRGLTSIYIQYLIFEADFEIRFCRSFAHSESGRQPLNHRESFTGMS